MTPPPRSRHPQPRPGTHHHHLVVPDPDPVPTPQPSYRTPMRYPWWGPGGNPPAIHHAKPTGDPPPPRRAGPRSGTHTPTVLPHPDAVSMVGSGWGPLRQFTTQNRQATHHHHPVIPNPDPVPTPQPSYRTPMRYPWWGPGGDPSGNSPRKTDRRPTTTTSSSPTPSRYPHPNRLTAPRCGIHGGARVGTPSAIHHAKPTGVTTTTPSFRPPSRNPGVGRGYHHKRRLRAPLRHPNLPLRGPKLSFPAKPRNLKHPSHDHPRRPD